MMKFLFKSLFLVATAGYGLANSLPNITAPALPAGIPTANPIELITELSPKCQGAFFSIIANPEFFKCVPVAQLLPVLTDPTFLPSVLKDPLTNAPKLLPIVDAICADPKCSDEGVSSALKAVQDGCSSKSDASNPITQLAIGVLTFYSPVRDIICFKNNKDELCLVETVTNILALPTPPTVLLGGIIDKIAFGEPKFFCTPCNKAIVNTLINFFTKNPQAVQMLEAAFHIGDEELVLGKLGIAIKCGFEFEDGKVGNPSIDPSKFTYLVNDTNSTSNGYGDESKNAACSMKEFSLVTAGSLLVSTVLMI